MTVAKKLHHNPTHRASTGELLKAANLSLEKNDLEKAYPYISQLLDNNYGDAQFRVNAGLIALALNNTLDAEKHFLHALKLDSENQTANYNLALLCINENNFVKAEEIFEKLIKKDQTNASLHNDIGVVYNSLGKIKKAQASFNTALRIDPNLKQAENNLNEILYHTQKKMLKQITGKKIAFFANHASFLNEIINNLNNKNEIRLFDGETTGHISDLMEWADIAWFEWCDNLIIEGSHLPKKCSIICRIHSYEVFTDMPSKVNWSNVDHIIFVNESVKKIFEQHVICKIPKSIIHNGVNTEKFNIPAKKEYGKRIASVGFINDKKNPTLLLYCFKKIHQYNPEFSLHIAGTFQDSRIQLYFEDFLRKNPLPVYFDNWVENMPLWYADKDFIISTSLFESFHYSIAEGMSSGLMPLIHNWYGSDRLYPTGYLFNDPDECLKLLMQFETEDLHQQAIKNRQFICDRYNIRDKLAEISNLLAQLSIVGNIWQKK